MKRKSVLAIALVMVLTVALLFLLAPGPTPTRQEIRLPDGNLVTLEKVTFSVDSQHDFSFDDSGLARFRQKLPRFLRRYFPSRGRMSWNTSSNALVLWFTMAGGKTGAPLDFGKLVTTEVADEHGCIAGEASYGSMSTGTNSTIYLATFTQFPRRQATFRVRFRPRGDISKAVAEFDIPNPDRGPFPVWAPEPLPAARTNADLVFMLKDYGNLGVGPSRKSPRFEALRNGLPAGDWEHEALNFSDATGNRGYYPFCTNEPAWMLEVDFVRNEQGSFLPSELYTITNLTVPRDGVAVQFTNGFTILGSPLALCAITGPGRYRFSNTVVTLAEPLSPGQGESTMSSDGYQGTMRYYRFEVSRSAPQVAIDVSSLASGTGNQDLRLLLRARGPGGLIHRLDRRHMFGRVWLFTLTGVTNAQSFDLDVMVHRPRREEFLVKPPDKW